MHGFVQGCVLEGESGTEKGELSAPRGGRGEMPYLTVWPLGVRMDGRLLEPVKKERAAAV